MKDPAPQRNRAQLPATLDDHGAPSGASRVATVILGFLGEVPGSSPEPSHFLHGRIFGLRILDSIPVSTSASSISRL